MTTEPYDVPPQWALDRANQLAEHESSYRALARYIAQHEEAPVDPDVEALKRILYAAGVDYEHVFFSAALAQYKKQIAK